MCMLAAIYIYIYSPYAHTDKLDIYCHVYIGADTHMYTHTCTGMTVWTCIASYSVAVQVD